MALTITKKPFPTGCDQNFVGHEVEEKWEIVGDGVGASPDLKPARMRKISSASIFAVDGTDIAFSIDNTVPKVVPVIPAGISGVETVYITVRGEFAG